MGKTLTPQQKWQQERQANGWKRISVFLPPEYADKAKAAAEAHGGLAEAIRHWLDTTATDTPAAPEAS